MTPNPPPIPEDLNPYRAPSADVDAPAPSLELASLGQRFGAALLDGLFGAGLGIFAAIALPMSQKSPLLMNIGIAIFVTAAIALLAANLIYIHRNGQTLGKKMLGIRVVRSNGDRIDLGRYIGMRWLPITLLGAIPLIGPFISLLNPLLIFRASRKCLHDDIADTIVITC
jgi:uncharacterized RDD family membrane protein YckC